MALFDEVLSEEELFKKPILGKDTMFLKRTGESTGLGRTLDTVLPAIGGVLGSALGKSAEGAELFSNLNQGLQNTSAKKFRTADRLIQNQVQQTQLESQARSQTSVAAASFLGEIQGAIGDKFLSAVTGGAGSLFSGGSSKSPAIVDTVGDIDTPINDYDKLVEKLELSGGTLDRLNFSF